MVQSQCNRERSEYSLISSKILKQRKEKKERKRYEMVLLIFFNIFINYKGGGILKEARITLYGTVFKFFF